MSGSEPIGDSVLEALVHVARSANRLRAIETAPGGGPADTRVEQAREQLDAALADLSAQLGVTLLPHDDTHPVAEVTTYGDRNRRSVCLAQGCTWTEETPR